MFFRTLRTTGSGCAVTVGLAAVTIAIYLSLVTGPGGSAKAGAPSGAVYSALSSPEPSGLPVVTVGSARALTLGRKGPVFAESPSQSEEGGDVVPTSIRKLPLDLRNASAWIAKSQVGCCGVTAARR
jgi:hypothetical protein